MDPFEAEQLREKFRRMVSHPQEIQTGYRGTGVWIRIQHRFGPRMTEWFLAFHMLGWGYVLFIANDLFSQPAWAAFKSVFQTQYALAWMMLACGLLRIGGLVVNGARKNVTPLIRQISAGIGCLIWVGISYCYASSGIVSTWLAIYPVFVIGELVNIHRAAHDQGETRNGSRQAS
jgi:hypothetical protein